MKSTLWTLVALPLGLAIACGDTDEPAGPGTGNAGGEAPSTAGVSATPTAGTAGSGVGGAGEAEGGAGSAGVAGAGAEAAIGGAAGGVGGFGEGGSAEGGAGGSPGASPVSVLQAAPGELVISEIMSNPRVVEDPVGEWFEIYNATNHAFDLNGLTVANATNDVEVATPLVLEAHGYAVFARNGTVAINGGVIADFVYGETIGLSNLGGLIRISAGDTVLDQVAYDDGVLFPDQAGCSMSFAPSPPSAASNDAAQNWCNGAKRFGTGDLGTPGAANLGCLRPLNELQVGDLVVTEIMANPSAVIDGLGEWFEIYNTSDDAFELQGMTVKDEGAEGFAVATSLIVPARGHVVLGPSANKAVNGNVPVDHAYSYSAFVLANGQDEIILGVGAVVIDQVAYDATTVPAGASLSLAPASTSSIANDLAESFCVATTSAGAGPHATPGLANDACP